MINKEVILCFPIKHNVINQIVLPKIVKVNENLSKLMPINLM